MLLKESIPIITINQVKELYSVDPTERYDRLISTFQSQFDQKPEWIVRSPGRVNLIGEHIDYSGYSVLPMAVEKDTIMALCANDTAVGESPMVELANVNPKYPKRTFKHERQGHVTIDPAQHEWSNYFKCGYKGVLDELNPSKVVTMKIVVDGTVPAGSGLSSSSSVVCTSALATLCAHDASLNKGDLTQTAIKSECYAGVQIGGMDQSISIMAPKGSALLIDFHPKLNATPIALPKTNPNPNPNRKLAFFFANLS